jgi:hypothetical protein
MAQEKAVETYDGTAYELDEMLYARHAEVSSMDDLLQQRGTPIPALFSLFYKFVQNPSSVSLETYKRMIDTDDTIGPGVDFLTSCLSSRLGRYQHPNPDITKWVNDRLDEVNGGWKNVVKEILSASWSGFCVAEKVWANTDNGFVVQKVVPLPPTTILFETERTGDLTPDGILQYQRNWNPVAMGYGIGYFGGMVTSGFGFVGGDAKPDPFARFGDLPFPMRTANSYNYLCIRIPTQKCVHYAFDASGKFGNPYGRSLLRRAYKWWVMKDTFLKMLAVALDRKGTPLTIVYADQNTTLADSAQVGDTTSARGKRVGIRADVAAKRAFENIHNDTTIILPGKKGQIFETDFVPQDAHADQFLAAIDMCNKSIMRALLIPSLIFTNGDGTGSYSLGQEHAKTFTKILDSYLVGLQEVLIQQLVKELIAYNFDESLWKKDGFGSFSKREFSEDEIQKVMEMYEKGITNGIIDTNDLNDLNKMRETIGFDERETVIEKPMEQGLFGNINEDEDTQGEQDDENDA